MNRSLLRTAIATVCLLLAVLLLPAPAAASDWTWHLAPYVWGASLGSELKIRDREIGGDSEIDAGKVLDAIDFTGMLHFEGQNGRNGFLLDTLYLNLGDSATRQLARPAGASLNLKGDLRAYIGEAAGIYNPRGDGSGV